MSFYLCSTCTEIRTRRHADMDVGTTYKKTRTQECGDICRYFKNYIGIIIHSKENEYIFIYL